MAFLQAATRNFSLLFFACLLFHLAGTWTLPLVDRDEPRFAEASREMIERGDYIIPHFNNQYRFDKPPLTYWFQVVSYRLFGQNDFAARFPTAVAASLTALIIFAWGRRIESVRLGLWAAIVFTLCLQTILHAKAAVADMWLVLFVTWRIGLVIIAARPLGVRSSGSVERGRRTMVVDLSLWHSPFWRKDPPAWCRFER
jgi:4-amino-4-deoxy-L-arabinose transferase-like glycosyltransferase